MNNDYFRYHMKRIAEVFGKYKELQVELIWNRLKHVNDALFDQACDELILNQSEKKKPLLADFLKAIEKVRRIRRSVGETEDPWVAMGKPHSEYKSVFSPDEIKTHIKIAKLASQGKISRAETKEYTDQLRSFLKKREHELQHYDSMHRIKVVDDAPKCSTCLDRGLVFAEDENHREFVFKCFCEKGQLETRDFPVWGKRYASKYKWVSDIPKADTCDC